MKKKLVSRDMAPYLTSSKWELPAALRERLGADFAVHEYGGGVLIVAGPAPEIGDRNQKADTPRLHRLARVLKPIRASRHWPVQALGKFSDADAFNAWLARFD